jgi:SAM-dependent methyltransferase
VSDFSVEWLTMREPADHRARSAPLAARLDDWLPGRRTARILDLGCGSGSNLRWLAPRLACPQHWLVLDDDPTLLAALPAAVLRWAAGRGESARRRGGGLRIGDRVAVRARRHDLAVGLPAIAGQDVVTASALADLVSLPWLQALAARCAPAGAALLLALSYDGRVTLTPRDAGDAALRDAVNRHQQGDKGFGPALGPVATATATTLLAARGYRIVQARSDWLLGPGDAALLAALVDGWAAAAASVCGSDAGAVQAWRRRRLDAVASEDLRARVGHTDLLALPPRQRGGP